MMDVLLEVKGMTCGHCEKAVKDTLLHAHGVKHVEVHLKENTVNVEYDQTAISLEEICEQIEEQGYDVVK